MQSHFELAEILLENGADPNVKDEYGRTALWYLVNKRVCSVEIVQLFYKYKADFINDNGSSVLNQAIYYSYNKNLDVVKFLVHDVGLDVNHIEIVLERRLCIIPLVTIVKTTITDYSSF